MALNWTGINALTREQILPKLVDNIFKKDPLFALMKAKGAMVKGTGKSYTQLVEYGIHTAESYTATGNYTTVTGNQDLATDARYDWKYFHTTAKLYGVYEGMNKSSATQLENYIKTIMNNAMKSLKDKISSELFNELSTGDTDGMTGMQHIIDDGTGADPLVGGGGDTTRYKTVGQIDGSSYTWWKSPVTDLAAAVIAIANIKQLLTTIKVNGGNPSAILCDPDTADKIESLVADKQRFNNVTMASLGFQSLDIHGVPVIPVNNMPAWVNDTASYHQILIPDFDYLKLHHLEDDEFKWDSWTQATTGRFRTSNIFYTGNLDTSKRAAHGKLVHFALS